MRNNSEPRARAVGSQVCKPRIRSAQQRAPEGRQMWTLLPFRGSFLTNFYQGLVPLGYRLTPHCG
ncbi:hypothetical protein PX52LOC_01384 [Limnoglobus roseus]|uniref:Uncharacterized protein n=1 Tax=Limnoglobus roseus TaxID=2598579 RepID=A0A5C1A7N7_9BACT|nr:hypothetical protein PX52LOC_01384 [Limnoglobus roseus]